MFQVLEAGATRTVLRLVQQHFRDVVQEIVDITRIPAPTFHEGERAAHLRDRLAAAGLRAHVDEAGNAVGLLAGDRPGPTVVLAAHMDTVFPPDTPIAVEQEGDTLRGPGVGDNGASLGCLVWAAQVLREAGLSIGGRVLFCGTVGEEGLGNLRGMRFLMERYRGEVDYVLPLDSALGGLIRQGVGSRRFRLRVSTEGGHSWGAFGVPSAVHSLARMVARIAEIRPPAEPKTTYNVGLISGGTSVNTIAAAAEAVIDTRSTDAAQLARLENQISQIVRQVAEDTAVEAALELLGDRPAGQIPDHHPLCQMVRLVHQHLGIQTRVYPSSTDGNVPLSMGIPAVTIGVTHGGNGHRPDEYIYTGPLVKGLSQVVLLVLALCSGVAVR